MAPGHALSSYGVNASDNYHHALVASRQLSAIEDGICGTKCQPIEVKKPEDNVLSYDKQRIRLQPVAGSRTHFADGGIRSERLGSIRRLDAHVFTPFLG